MSETFNSNNSSARSELPLQKRALFYVFDRGTGIGHLRRLSTIAEQMQGRFACLVVTGHRAAAHWFVPQACEYVRIPSWDGLLGANARYWGRAPFVNMSKAQAVEFRTEILRGIVRGFKPDAIFVDHLPLGAEEELAAILRDAPCRKYFVTRGVLNETENLRQLILGGKAGDYLRVHYDRVFVASDPRVFDFCRQYNIPAEIREKAIHVGYVTQKIPYEQKLKTRTARGIGVSDIWVVASAGGGQHGEELIENCIGLGNEYPDIAFDIVIGPRSKLASADPIWSASTQGRLRIHKEVPHLAQLNASADIVISAGGYNTLLEAVQGSADILCFPSRKNTRDEQYQHAARLKKFVNIEVSTEVRELVPLFDKALTSLLQHRRGDRRGELLLDGAANIRKVVEQDLGSTSFGDSPAKEDSESA
ncbi:MAG: hypothetical protein HOP13_01195 [Alphaproteobacteria bacterium]|nr:hypothetical protein [Alphaproteobacteria bacterium]